MAIVNITTQNDADFYRSFVWKTVSNVPVNMAGMTLEMMLRRRAEDETAVLRLATDTGEIVVTNAAGGQFTVRITQDALARLGVGDFDQSNIATSDTQKIRIWSGTLTNIAGPTR
jgi:hypothetical protein